MFRPGTTCQRVRESAELNLYLQVLVEDPNVNRLVGSVTFLNI